MLLLFLSHKSNWQTDETRCIRRLAEKKSRNHKAYSLTLSITESQGFPSRNFYDCELDVLLHQYLKYILFFQSVSHLRDDDAIKREQ